MAVQLPGGFGHRWRGSHLLGDFFGIETGRRAVDALAGEDGTQCAVDGSGAGRPQFAMQHLDQIAPRHARSLNDERHPKVAHAGRYTARGETGA